MRNAVVFGKFNNLRVYKNKLYIFWGRFVKKAGDNRIDTYRFTAACGTCNKQMRHTGKVCHYHIACNINAQCDGKRRFAVFKLFAFKDCAYIYRAGSLVWHFNANCRLVWNWRFYTHTACSKVKGNIVCKVCYFAYFNTCKWLKLVSCYRRTAGDIDNFCLHTKACKGIDQQLCIGFKLVFYIPC